MGDIINMKSRIGDKQNSVVESINNIKEHENFKKTKRLPELKTKGIKGFATLLGPTVGKYRISKDQRNLQIKGRVTLTALATALAISGLTGVALHNHTSNRTQQTAIEQDQETSKKDDVLKNAEDAILKCVFGDDLKNIKNASVDYKFDNHDGSYTVSVYYTDSNDIAYSYSNDSLSLDKLLNNKDIVSLIDNAIYVHRLDNPSKKALSSLDESTKVVNNKSYKLDKRPYS